MNVLKVRVNEWREARGLADHLRLWRFRGQENASWSLRTTLERSGERAKLDAAPVFLANAERRIIEEFQRRAHHFVPDPPSLRNQIEWLALMQHFGAPTRLLDFTNSFYVAAFFALENASSECAIWCVQHPALHKAAASFLGLSKDQETSVPYWQTSHRMSAVAQNAFEKSESVSSHFVFEVEPFRVNERLAIQQGLFLYPLSIEVPFVRCLEATFGLPASVFADAKTEEYDRKIHTQRRLYEAAVIEVVLPGPVHKDAVRDLRNMNITAATLFPGLDGFARSLHWSLRNELS